MLSAVESFSPAAAAARYAHHHHHHPFAIAAAAAAAGGSVAAAASIVPHHQITHPQPHHSQALVHHSLSHTPSILSSHQTLGSVATASLLPLPLSLPQHSPQQQQQQLSEAGLVSPLSLGSTGRITSLSSPPGGGTSSSSSGVAASAAVAMSSAEFARPHPKQPRYSCSTSNSVTSSSNSNSNSSNGIPLHIRNHLGGSQAGCLGGTSPSRTKYSTEQAGPVNLVTNNSSNSTSSPSPKDANSTGNTIECLNGGSICSTQATPSSGESAAEVMAGIYAQKLPFTTQSANAAAAAAAAYQLNYPHLYGRGPIYGTLYPGHHHLAASRNQMHSRPTYISSQHEPFSPYLPPPPVTYSPPSVPAPAPPAGPLLGPPPSQQQLGHSAASLLNSSHNNTSSNSSHTSSISTPTTIHNNNNNNNNNTIKQLPLISDRQQQPPPSSHPSLHHHVQQTILSAERQSLSHVKDKEAKGSAPIYLNGKLTTAATATAAGFKVPSGKEGSLKHRILTRPPYTEKDIRRRSPITATIVRSSSNNNAPTNFTKGSLIELANGELRRVEDMRTEDFVHSAEKSQHLQLADSTVVKIVNTPNNVIITFSYNKNRSKVDMEASQEHPFFVYGQGWASCNPELSMQVFGLKCQRLQVGDVCISLIPRESYSHTGSTPHSPHHHLTAPISCTGVVSAYSAGQQQQQHHPLLHYKDDMAPQNLSRKSLSSGGAISTTIPTTATGTAVSSRLSAGPLPPHHLPHPAPPHLAICHIPVQHYEMHPYDTSPPIPPHHHTSPPATSIALTNGGGLQSHRQQQHILISEAHFLAASSKAKASNNGDHQTSPPPSLSAPSSRPPSNQPYYLGTSENPRSASGGGLVSTTTPSGGEGGFASPNDQQNSAESALSRKRRWSAPDNICDDEGGVPTSSAGGCGGAAGSQHSSHKIMSNP